MSASDSLSDLEGGVTPAGETVVIRGPWGDLEPPPAPPDTEHAERAAAARREAREARAARHTGQPADQLYQLTVMTVARAQHDDPVAVTNAVLERLAHLSDDELRALIRQRLAGHRIR